jgi:CheY-like chemotaxis protein
VLNLLSPAKPFTIKHFTKIVKNPYRNTLTLFSLKIAKTFHRNGFQKLARMLLNKGRNEKKLLEVNMQHKILFVDDEASLRRTMTIGLSQNGYDTEPCENGVSALKKLDSFVKNHINLDAVVVDICLPDINGIKLAKIIKFKYPGIPIILISGYADRYNREEIKDLKVSAFLEKPFTPDELTQQFLGIMTRQEEEETPQTSAEKLEARSESAYMLLRLEEDADFFKIHNTLYYMDNVLYCDATKGDYDIFLLAQADHLESLKEMSEKIKAMSGIKSVDFLEVSRPVLDESTNAIINVAEDVFSEDSLESGKKRDLDQKVCSYLLLDVERERMDEIYPTLRLDEDVIFCDYTTGKYNLVLFVSGCYFDEIDRFIQEKIISLNGVLKVKEYPVINLVEM